MARLNPDATAAVNAAQAGNCREAMKYLYDAAPHMQAKCDSPDHEKHVADFRTASVIVAGRCTRDEGKVRGKKKYNFEGRNRVRRKRR